MAVGEACNNATEHGHVINGSFALACAFDHDGLRIEVKDLGSGFDPDDKEIPVPREQRGSRGLGIFMMRSLMDVVRFAVGGAGTTVMLCKRRPLTAAATAARHRSCSADGGHSRKPIDEVGAGKTSDRR